MTFDVPDEKYFLKHCGKNNGTRAGQTVRLKALKKKVKGLFFPFISLHRKIWSILFYHYLTVCLSVCLSVTNSACKFSISFLLLKYFKLQGSHLV